MPYADIVNVAQDQPLILQSDKKVALSAKSKELCVFSAEQIYIYIGVYLRSNCICVQADLELHCR